MTTHYTCIMIGDCLVVAILSEITEVNDIQFMATKQFKTKYKELARLSAHGLVNGDQKSFSFKTEKFEGDVSLPLQKLLTMPWLLIDWTDFAAGDRGV